LLAVFAGRLSPEKGLFTLVEAWAGVVNTYPTATLVLLGEGPLREDLQTAIARAGLGSRVLMPGIVDEVEPFHRAADLFVLPSTQEGMSIALLEAMALGLPVVACDIAGNRRVIQTGEHGALVPVGVAGALASAMAAVIESPDRAGAMARSARRRVQQEFSLERMARLHGELFLRLMREGRALASARG
jgi:glycosyltransferase involved in cell wall biosynthesis